MPRLLIPVLLAAAMLAGMAAPLSAATLEVQVSDDSGRPLPGAAVFLESKEARAAARPGAMVEVVQAERQFRPVVTLLTVGTAVSFPNRDTVRHHVYSFSAARRFEIKLYVGTPAAPVVFDRPGIAVLGCNIHDSMAAWVLAVETPHHGLTGADGRLALAGVPPGSYRLRAWHPSLPAGSVPTDQPLLLAAAGTPPVALQLTGAVP